MSDTILIATRQAGRRRALLPGRRIPPPPKSRSGDKPLLLRDLITHVVAQEVGAFQERQESRRFFQVLTERQVADGATRGKVDAGGREPQAVTAPQAVATALQAFEDGLYFVFVDGKQATDLQETVMVNPDSEIQFLRLVALAGG